MASQKFDAVVATPRTGKFNKNHARRVRVEGKIPAVVYGAGMESVAVTVDPKVVTKILHSESGHNTIFDLNVEGAALAKAMIVDWQHEPIKGKLLHIDFKRIAMDKAMRVSVPVLLTGIPAGVKTAGGVLDQILREVEIECLPATSRTTSTSTSRALRCTAPSTSPTCRRWAPSSISASPPRWSPT